MPTRFLKLSIVYKIGLVSVLLAVLTASVVAGVFYFKTSSVLVEHTLSDLSRQLQREGQELAFKTDALRRHVIFLKGTPPINGIIEAERNNGLDAQGNTTEQWRQRLGTIFVNLAKANPEYLQIRYIRGDGQELVRVERADEGVDVLGEDALQDKFGSDYVDETLKQANDSLYLSEINLNREYGRIMVPYTPVLRAATPVIDMKGEPYGVVVINMNFGYELDQIRSAHRHDSSRLYITDHRGSYLVHPDRDKEFGFDRGRRYRLQEEFPQLSAFFLPENQQTSTTVVDETTDGQILVFNKVSLTGEKNDRFVAIGLADNYSTVVGKGDTVLRDTLLLSFVVVIIGAVVAFVFAGTISRPIRQLTLGVDNFRANSDSCELPVDRHDELGRLARAFSEMMEYVIHSQNDLRQLNQNLETLVEQRTRQVSDAQTRTQTIVDTVVDGIITIDKKGVVQTFNRSAETIFGFSADEVVGKNVKILMPDSYAKEHDGYLHNYLETGQEKIIGIGREVTGLRKDGSTFPMDLAVSRMQVENELFFTGIVRDITERKRIDVMKNEFISTVSHELRTPLTSIRGALGLLYGGAVGELPNDARDLMKIASNNTERLLLLINDILDMQKIEAGNMAFKFSVMELGPFIEQAIVDNAYYGEENNVKFVLTNKLENARVFADRDRLLQVLNNLMSNAAKFSPEGGTVELHLAHHEGMFRVSVSDNGPGVPEEFRDKIFEKFSQADSSSTRQIGGTGLGLNIARLLVERHGGRIDFVSKEGVGSTFYFELPELYNDPRNIDADHITGKSGEHAPCILIVEDDQDIAAIMQRHFAEAGFNTVIAKDVSEATRIINAGEVELRLMTLDIMLPDGNGMELLEFVRQHDKYADLPVVVVSVLADETRDEMGSGVVDVVDWVPKPIDEERLLSAVEAAAANGRKPRVLHVEDDPDVHKVVSLMLKDKCELSWTTTLEASRQLLAREEIDLVLLDIGLPDGSGLDLIDVIDRYVSPPRVVIFSAQDVSSKYADRVEAVMVKSHTTDKQLVSKLLSVLDKHNRKNSG